MCYQVEVLEYNEDKAILLLVKASLLGLSRYR